MFKFLLLFTVLGKFVVASLSPFDFFNQLNNQSEALLLDVRLREDYKSGHIESAQWAGNKMVLDSIVALHPKDVPVFIYCDYGQRTKVVIKILKRSGFKQVIELNGGLDLWIRQGFPLSDE